MTEPTKLIEMPASDVNNLDDVVHELGIEDSDITPAEAVRRLKNKLLAAEAALVSARQGSTTEPPAEMIERARALTAIAADTFAALEKQRPGCTRPYTGNNIALTKRIVDALQSERALARKEALEEAAKVAENIPDIRCLDHGSGAVSYTPSDKDDIAAAIRSLIEQPGGGTADNPKS